MLKTIFNAIVSALKGFGRMAGRVATAPFRMLNAVTGGGAGEPSIDIPEVAPPAVDIAAEAPADARIYEDIANALMSWCADSITCGAPAPVPTTLPLSVREWAPGLTREECAAIMLAEKSAVATHLRGLFTLPGVRKVQRLRPQMPWSPVSLPEPESDTLYYDVTAEPLPSPS